MMKSAWLVIMVLTLVSGALAQTEDDLKARDEAFSRCNQISRDRETRYKLCKDTLSKYPTGDDQHRQTAETFVRAFERAMSYAKALQAFWLSKPGTWFVYEPDLKIDLPNVDQTLSVNRYKIRINRSFKSADEEAMIKKAEAVYGGQFRYIDSMRSVPESWGDNLPDEVAPLWGSVGRQRHDDGRGRQRRQYYYDPSISARTSTHRNVFRTEHQLNVHRFGKVLR
jgi:hypothetical protein